MTRRGADEVQHIPLNDGTLRQWRGERWGGRYLFIGPLPGKHLWHSVEARSWIEASNDARLRWEKADPVKRNIWYGPAGRFTQSG